MNILIGISWPYANGELHLGHIASSLSGDVIARYHRAKGNKVVLVSGSDAHGTGIDIAAFKIGKTQKEIVDENHEKLKEAFNKLGFSFDLYNRTDDSYHKEIVRENFLKYYEKGYIYEKVDEQLYCECCDIFLADRYIIGNCPKCGKGTKGDECDECGALLKINEVINPRCAICGNPTSYRKTKNLYFAFSRFQSEIERLNESKKNQWRANAYSFTKKYLDEGIPDRCVSRDLKWGIDIPIKGYENKKIYVWCENVVGYISACRKYCEQQNLNWEDFWKKDRNNKLYFVHAKDNIPFHTIILPSLLLALDDTYKLPDIILSDEYLTLEGGKISKSKGNYISALELLERYSVDAIRYYFLSHEPTKKDLNFSWEDFINSLNGELLGKWGNFVNRTLVFINKSFNGKLKKYKTDKDIELRIKELYKKCGELIDKGNTKEALSLIFEFINFANKYFDDKQPWSLARTDKYKCEEVLYSCVNIIFNINNLLKPFLPFSGEVIDKYLNKRIDSWKYQDIKIVDIDEDIKPLYTRYDKTVIAEEIEKLNLKKQNTN